jgi:O-antigen/teichoic acid export membrane protein
MTEGTLRDKTVSGMFWSSIGRFGALALNFLSNLVLARLLMPSDYGAVGMLAVFIAVSNEFVLAGFGAALIQKKRPTDLDYTSVFWWNLVVSVLFYGILFVSGPAIARFYNIPELCTLLRFQSLSIIIMAFSLMPAYKMQKEFRFKQLSMRQLLATVVGTIVGIVMALRDYGVWSLVASSLAGVLLLWKMIDWRPSWQFSWASLRELFKFGGLMALSSLVMSFYWNLQSLVIGKKYSAQELGYFTQANKLEDVPVHAMAQIIAQVSFPLFSELQDEPKRLLEIVRRNIKTTSYLVFPALAMLAVVAQPLIVFLYGEKWEPAVPFFQVLCLYGMMSPLNGLLANVSKSLGRSDIFFFSQLAMRVLGIVAILLAARFGIYGLLWTFVSLEYLFYLINSLISRRLIGYGLRDGIRDFGGYYLLSLAVAGITYGVGLALPLHPYVTMLIQMVLYAALYGGASHLLRLEGYATCREIVFKKLFKKQ